jgi:transcriptional regulator with XRE-family HTH domain
MTTELEKAVGRVIRTARLSRKSNLLGLSRKAGISLGFLSQIERGNNSSSVNTLEAIARALGTSLWKVLKTAEESIPVEPDTTSWERELEI